MQIQFPLSGVIIAKNETDHADRCLYVIHLSCGDGDLELHLTDESGMDECAMRMAA
ncbi:hypothetical protein J2W94_002371 [Pseudoxanthomonas sacheonensis]|uniref:Uncharacterized protein n=1 Tax=Pseudoxanthomonas sacheonensis TaxID=443615 RepID=A0ABU1RTH6_9GAMM|nr:hypothetical protein [Pseudoxanthomonas sacheonensis]